MQKIISWDLSGCTDVKILVSTIDADAFRGRTPVDNQVTGPPIKREKTMKSTAADLEYWRWIFAGQLAAGIMSNPRLALNRTELAENSVTAAESLVRRLELSRGDTGRGTTGGYRIRFDGPPGPEGPRFIEVEDMSGTSFRLGEWVEAEDGSGDWFLVVEEGVKKP